MKPVALEVIHYEAKGKPKGPPLLFVHGSFAGAWCWDEHFLTWFRSRGHAVHAPSLRGHGGSGGRDELHRHGIADYVEDVRRVAETLSEPPVLIGHSMGGFVAMKYLERFAGAGLVLMASVPPTGLAGPAASMTVENPLLLWRIGMVQAFGEDFADADLLSQALFSRRLPDDVTTSYLKKVQMESRRATMDMYGPDQPNTLLLRDTPTLVMGGRHDALIPAFHVQATAALFGQTAHLFPEMGHGLMLEPGWEEVAQSILDWLGAQGLHG
ncbi:MAG: alpha/beta hydrolase [Magnetospirillum sp. WYHS-4]